MKMCIIYLDSWRLLSEADDAVQGIHSYLSIVDLPDSAWNIM
ncbi:LOW QUALITY PROTEIN: hypothetical protein MAR_015091 [Mya arenaria]|uniref:Uncharacterized protein n=1 Tax=Mya arenaria TaxID=6604 RepID=A0ABY7FJB3_MYAAR|nr:LOW QUALITY PROTEIN: hypothetical protein MAR_015091 [Mya arenaria]